MDTKSLLIETATELFQQKGYKSVGINEILRACDITKGALYHHFPNGKDELLIACLNSMKEAITGDIKDIFSRHASALAAFQATLDKLAAHFEQDAQLLAGHTFSSIVSEMATLSEPIREACSSLYTSIQDIYAEKLVADGFTSIAAHSIAVLVTASIEGSMMLSLTQSSSEPLKVVSRALPNLLKEF